MILSRIQRRDLHNAVIVGDQSAVIVGDQSAAFRVLPEAGQIPQALYDAFTAVAKAEGQLEHARTALKELENDITATSPLNDGWPADTTRDYIKTMRKSFQHRLATSISKI